MWSQDIIGCCRSENAGINCCVQQTCCQVCVWGSALGYTEVSEAYCAAVSLAACNEVGGVVGYFMRRKLVEKYEIEEDTFTSCLYSFCCPCLARVQEVDTVMQREGLRYSCARLLPKLPVEVEDVEIVNTPKAPSIHRIERERHQTNHKK